MYSKKTTLLIGFHGCDKSVRDAVLNGKDLKPSLNTYDWLGNGIYFWEADPQRAMEWAEQAARKVDSSIEDPAVIGAVIDLGYCLDLMNRDSVSILKSGYDWLKKSYDLSGEELPQNKNVGGSSDLLLRYLDCAVIEKIHSVIEENNMTPFDSVRGLFTEGKEAYPNSGFMEKTHIQLCIKNPNCIKGYFLPRELDKNYQTP